MEYYKLGVLGNSMRRYMLVKDRTILLVAVLLHNKAFVTQLKIGAYAVSRIDALYHDAQRIN